MNLTPLPLSSVTLCHEIGRPPPITPCVTSFMDAPWRHVLHYTPPFWLFLPKDEFNLGKKWGYVPITTSFPPGPFTPMLVWKQLSTTHFNFPLNRILGSKSVIWTKKWSIYLHNYWFKTHLLPNIGLDYMKKMINLWYFFRGYSQKVSQLRFFWCSYIWTTVILLIRYMFWELPDKKLTGAEISIKKPFLGILKIWIKTLTNQFTLLQFLINEATNTLKASVIGLCTSSNYFKQPRKIEKQGNRPFPSYFGHLVVGAKWVSGFQYGENIGKV